VIFAMPPQRFNHPRLTDHASAIGYLCILYNSLEAHVNMLLGTLAPLPDEELACFTNQFDLLKKLPTLKALAFKRKPSQLWFDDIELMAWAVESWIMPKRNRYVHDIWFSPPSGTFRRFERTRIAKAQSHQPPTLTTYEHIPTTADEIWALVDEVRDLANIFRLLESAFKSGAAASTPERVFPQQYRDQWRARRKPPKESKPTACHGLNPEDQGR
jgi:hypothetical protein